MADTASLSMVDQFLVEGSQVCKTMAQEAVVVGSNAAKEAAGASQDFIIQHYPSMLHDAAWTLAAFLFTHFAFKQTKAYLGRNLPNWDKVSSFNQNRLSCEIALLPSRFAIFLCCVPAILNAFADEAFWTGLDTSRTIIVCGIMAGSYAYDLLIERNDILSLIHHFFGPAMLLWIRSSFATFTQADAHMNRLLVSFIFFGAGCGGTITTLMLVFMKLMKQQLSQTALYQAVNGLSWVLTLNTFVSTMFGSWYMLVFHETLMSYWGWWCYLPLVLCSFEFYLQWRWALRFQSISDQIGARAGYTDSAEIQVVPESLHEKLGGSVGLEKPTLRLKSIGLAILVSSWALSYFTVFFSSVRKTVFRTAL